MQNYTFSQRSEKNLIGVHEDLVAVARKALDLSQVDFAVIDGIRTVEEQKELVLRGRSKTMNSRHLTGHAIDIAAYVGNQISWEEGYYVLISRAFKKAAEELDVKITWGGDWPNFKDWGHYHLQRKIYP